MTKSETVESFARKQAQRYGKEIGKKPREAYRKLKAIFQAILNTMKVGEEDEIPLPQIDGRDQPVLFLKKTGRSRFIARAK